MTSSVPHPGPGGSEPTEPGHPVEYLQQGSGAPVAPRSSGGGGGRRTALVAGGVLGLAAVGGGVWAAMTFLGTGAQPAEALPASTIGYLSVDLDPSGSQKVEALQTLRKFDAFREEVGLDTDDDVRRFLFDELAGEACPDVDYADDVEPWLGHRGAVAAVDVGEDEPAAVFVLQVRDEDAAGSGLGALRDCLAGSGSTGTEGDPGAWVVEDGWAVVAETQEIADEVAAAAAEDPLSEDDDFTRWTGEAGGAGIATVYAAPEAGRYLAELAGDVGGLGMLSGTSGFEEPGTAPEEEVAGALEDFEGMAATLRFDDGALELEAAAGSGATDGLEPTEDAGGLVAALPEQTAAALGLGLGDGWFGTLLDHFASGTGGDPEDALEELVGVTGLELPEDVETLTEGGVAVALGDDFDPEAVFAGDGDLPLAVVLGGDPEEIEAVLDKLPEVTDELLGRTVEGGDVVVGPDQAWREAVAAGGDLGGSDRFRSVVTEADRATGLVYVDFDAAWVAGLAAEDPELEGNLAPLSALGVSSWLDGDVTHTLVRVSTD